MKIIINKYCEVKLISNNSNYVIGKDEKVIEINSISNDECIQIYQDVFDNYHVEKMSISNNFKDEVLYSD